MMKKQNPEKRTLSGPNGRATPRLLSASAALLLLVACGGDGEPDNVQTNAAQASEPETAAAVSSRVDIAAASTAEDIGQAVADVYVQAFAELNAALADHPDEAEALECLREVHERHVQDLVALGRKIEALPASDKATVEAAVNQVQSKLQYDADIKPVYDAYRALHSHYREAGVMRSNREFNRLFAGFNILTQYAFFDLLKSQSPEEAERLGL